MRQFRYIIQPILYICILSLSNFSNGSSVTSSKVEKSQNERKTIVGGIFAPVHRYHYMVTLQYNVPNYGAFHSCGGTLIAPDIILTAAHCYNETWEETWGLPHAIIGDYDHNNATDGGEQFNLEVLAIHHNWDERLLEEDIMLFKVLGQSTKTPVRLNEESDNPVENQTLTVIGWGRDSENTSPSVLKEATLEYLPNKNCYGILEDAFQTSLCAYDADGETNERICSGDSGGPILLKGTKSADDIQVGIVSKGPSCWDPQSPFFSIYARVSAYYDWIREHICSSSSSPPAQYRCQTVSPYPSISVPPSMQPSVTSLPTIYKERFTLVFRFDKYPGDVVWSIYEYSDDLDLQDAEPIISRMDGYSESFKQDFAHETFYLEPDKTFVIYVFDLNRDGLTKDEKDGYFYLYKGTENFGNFVEDNVVLWHTQNYTLYAGYFFNSTISPSTTPPPTPNPYNQFITVVMTFDDFPNEVAWGVFDDDYDTVYYLKPSHSYIVSARKEVSEVAYLPHSTQLNFCIQNFASRGIPSVKVYEGLPSDGNLLAEKSGSFDWICFDFTLSEITLQPSISPSNVPSVPQSMSPSLSKSPSASPSLSKSPSVSPSQSPSVPPSISATYPVPNIYFLLISHAFIASSMLITMNNIF